MKFYRNEQIENIAEQRLHDFERQLGRPISLPVDIELFGDVALGLSILWESIEELPGEKIFGGLGAAEQLVVMNERRLPEFNEKPGFCRLTEGHEIGHWDLFVDKATLDHATFLETITCDMFAYRNSAATIRRLSTSVGLQRVL